MTVKGTLAAIRAEGMAGKYHPDLCEFEISYRKEDVPDREKRGRTAYFTEDEADAIGTARAMRAELAATGKPAIDPAQRSHAEAAQRQADAMPAIFNALGITRPKGGMQP